MRDLDEPSQHALARRLGSKVLAGAALIVLCGSAAPAFARPTLDAERLAELEQYSVLTFADAYRDGVDKGKAIGVIDATPEEVFRTVTDFSRYKEYMPRVTGVTQIARTSDNAQVLITAELPFPAGRTWIEANYRFERIRGGIYRIRFDMQRGNMRQYLGSLYIEPWNGSATRTAVTYELVAEPAVSAPKSFVNKGVKRSVGKFVHALRQQVNDLHRLGMLHPVQRVVATAPETVVKPNPATLKARR